MTRIATANPLQPFLAEKGIVVLDGGLATELEARGADINDDLWSAKLLLDGRDSIRAVHLDYLGAGADCILSASYQATVEGFLRRGLSRSAAKAAIQASVSIACESRDLYWGGIDKRKGRIKPLVAASVGPFGAYLADGSEYDGKYGLSMGQLMAFHRERWHLLVESGADLLACETVPSLEETNALVELLQETPNTTCWVSFSCKDAEHLHDGNLLCDAVESIAEKEQVIAVGANCTPPSLVPGLIESIRRRTEKPIVVYPNSGETYDASTKTWSGIADPIDFADAARKWYGLGARLIGGCCRTGPKHIRAIRTALVGGA